MVLSYHFGAGNWAQVLSKNNMCSKLPCVYVLFDMVSDILKIKTVCDHGFSVRTFIIFFIFFSIYKALRFVLFYLVL